MYEYITEDLGEKYINNILNTNAVSNSNALNKMFENKLKLIETDSNNTVSPEEYINLVNEIKPSEIYNFADQDHVSWSFNIPSYSFKVTALAVIEILEALKDKKIKYFYCPRRDTKKLAALNANEQYSSLYRNPNLPPKAKLYAESLRVS